MKTDQRLKIFKAELRELKDSRSRAEGSYETLMDKLKRDFGIESYEEAEKKLAEWKKEIRILGKKLEVKLKELEDAFSK